MPGVGAHFSSQQILAIWVRTTVPTRHFCAERCRTHSGRLDRDREAAGGARRQALRRGHRGYVESPAKICAFNVRRFGKAKMRDAKTNLNVHAIVPIHRRVSAAPRGQVRSPADRAVPSRAGGERRRGRRERADGAAQGSRLRPPGGRQIPREARFEAG